MFRKVPVEFCRQNFEFLGQTRRHAVGRKWLDAHVTVAQCSFWSCARNPYTSDSVKTVKLFLRYVGQWRCSSTLLYPRLYRWERAICTRWIGCRLGPKMGLDALEKSRFSGLCRESNIADRTTQCRARIFVLYSITNRSCSKHSLETVLFLGCTLPLQAQNLYLT